MHIRSIEIKLQRLIDGYNKFKDFKHPRALASSLGSAEQIIPRSVIQMVRVGFPRNKQKRAVEDSDNPTLENDNQFML